MSGRCTTSKRSGAVAHLSSARQSCGGADLACRSIRSMWCTGSSACARWRARTQSEAGGATLADGATLGLGGLLEGCLEPLHLATKGVVRGSEDAYGEQASVAGVADCDRRDRDTGRHLH